MLTYNYCNDQMPENDKELLFCTDEGDKGQYVYPGYRHDGGWVDIYGTPFEFDSGVEVYAWAYWPEAASLPIDEDDFQEGYEWADGHPMDYED